MQSKLEELSNRNNNIMSSIYTGETSRTEKAIKASSDIKDSVIDPKRVEGEIYSRVFRAGINHSMWIYLILITISILAHILYLTGLLR